MNAPRLVGTLFGVGLLKPAPGTWGSLAALPLAWLVHAVGSWPLLLAATLAAIPLGVWAIGGMIADGAAHDPSEGVIDEVAGQWIALLPVSYGAAFADVDILALWPGWVAAFLLFRLFDIWKPGPVGHFDRQGTALSVVLDDVAAGILAALGVVILAVFYHIAFLGVLG